MDLDKAKAHMEAATQSAKDQIELNRTVMQNQLDASDQIILRKAADAVIEMAPAVAADPT